jgi:hypothetical protein
MERYLAVVKNGVVDNLLVVDPTDSKTIAHFGGLLLPEGSPVAIGWAYDGTNFTPPPAPAKSSEELAAEKQAATLAQIAALEAQQARPLRELLLDPANAFAQNKLAALDAEIAALRAQLVR